MHQENGMDFSFVDRYHQKCALLKQMNIGAPCEHQYGLLIQSGPVLRSLTQMVFKAVPRYLGRSWSSIDATILCV